MSTARMPGSGAEPSGAWGGWIAFAGIMLVLTGFFDILQGLTALLNDEYYAVRNGQLLVFDFTAWGWIWLLWGIVLIAAGFGLLRGVAAARWFAVAAVFINAIGQVAFLNAFPIWSTIVIALDVFVIFALTARWGEARAAMD
jgi:hypothetical protein